MISNAKRTEFLEQNNLALEKAVRFLLEKTITEEDLKGVIDTISEEFSSFSKSVSDDNSEHKEKTLTGISKARKELLKKYNELETGKKGQDETMKAMAKVLLKLKADFEKFENKEPPAF